MIIYTYIFVLFYRLRSDDRFSSKLCLESRNLT